MSTVSASFTLDQAFANNLSNWPVLISNGSGAVTVTVSGNIIFTNDSQNFIVGSGNQVVIEGANNVIDVSGVTGYKGLGLNDSTLSPISTLTIQNLGIITHGGSTLNNTFTNNPGWFVSGENYSNGSHADVSNCYSTGTIIQIGGGIFGQKCQGTATNCYSTGNNTNSSAGGIFGGNCTGTATNCYSTGNLGNACGGICGPDFTGTATNCYSTGSILTNNAGGIFGARASSATANNCYSTGSIGPSAGGIFGTEYINSTATNCYSTGIISGDKAGGIFGPCDINSSANNTSSATKCFSTGNITGSQAGGIFGYINGHGGTYPSRIINISATNCFSTGLISSVNGGGIVGTAVDGGTYTATNCYSIGNGLPGDYGNGQIFGITGNSVNINAINCYGAGTSPNGICGNNYSGNPLTITNCYNANGAWSDTTANSNLTGTGGSLGVIGTKWTSVLSANTPYKLTAFNTQIYSPNTATINASDPYTTSVGNTAFNNFNKILNNGSATATINGSTGTIAFTNTSTPGLDTVNIYALAPSGFYGINTFALTINAGCFLEGTHILCFIDNEEKYVSIETLHKGDLVKTFNNGYTPIKYIGSYECVSDANNGLYKLSKNDYSELFDDLILTGGHPILVDELSEQEVADTLNLWSECKKTDNKYRLLTQINSNATLYHIDQPKSMWDFVLENENTQQNFGIYANGLLTETMEEDYFLNSSNLKQIE